MYQDLPEKDFLRLIFTSEDRLGMHYIEEVKVRRMIVLPFMCDVLTKEKNYRFKDKRFWGVIHAAHILGILGDSGAFDALISASKFSNAHNIDWIWEALPECYLRLGKGVIPRLMNHIQSFKSSDYYSVSSEIYGLWNLWEVYPEEREEIEDFMLQALKDPETNPAIRADLIGDFAQLGRKDLKPLFEGFYERGEVDLETFSREDVDYFFQNVHKPPGHHYNLEGFYSNEEIEYRQKRWKQEEEDSEQESVEDFILKNFSRISRNDPCPCGSGKKFKKCHLSWAEQERTRLKDKEVLDLEHQKIGFAIFSERRAETDLRKFLTRKGNTGLFSELKAKVLEAINAPTEEFTSRGFFSYFEPVFSKIEFKDKNETKEFMAIFMEYFNALSHQLPGYPKAEKLFH